MDQNIDWIYNPCFKSKRRNEGPTKREVVVDKVDPMSIPIYTMNDQLQLDPKTYDEGGIRDFIGNIPDPNKKKTDFLDSFPYQNKGKPDFLAKITDQNRGNRDLLDLINHGFPYSVASQTRIGSLIR